MQKIDKITIAIFILAVLGLFFFGKKSPVNNLTGNNQPYSSNVPWYISYNSSPEFIHTSAISLPLALPNNSVGQANDNSGSGCSACSLFPSFSMVQL